METLSSDQTNNNSAVSRRIKSTVNSEKSLADGYDSVKPITRLCLATTPKPLNISIFRLSGAGTCDLACFWEGHTVEAPPLQLSANQDEEGSLGSIVTALDGQRVLGNTRVWTARIQGVHGNGRDWWIQLAPEGDDSAGVVLRCSRHATAAQASAVLRQWSPMRSRSIRILKVMTTE